MPRNYDLVAPFYPLLERAAFGNVLNEARNSFVAHVANADSALLIGEGNGRFLAECLKEKRGGSITVVDASPRMLALSCARIECIPHITDVELVCCDFARWPRRAAAFDVIVTHFFLDLFKPASQRRMIAKISALSKPQTAWVNVDFRAALQSHAERIVEWMQYRFDRLLSGIEAEQYYDPASLIAEFGWNSQEERSFCGGSVVANLFHRPVAAFISDAPVTSPLAVQSAGL